MKIEKKILPDHQVTLTVDVDPQQMEGYKRRAAHKMAQSGKIPGFRPGKAPFEIILRNFGESAVNDQAVDLFVDEEYSNILKEAEIKPGASGKLESVESLDPPKFVFQVPLAPEVDLGNYHNLRLPYKWTAPGKKELEAAIEDLRQMYATTETVDRPVQFGDYILADLKSATEGLTRGGFATFVRKEPRNNEWPFPGFAWDLVGLKPGDSKVIAHKFPKDWEFEALQGKPTEIEVTIKTVRSVSLPDLDDEFAKTSGIAENLEGLRNAIAKDVEARSRADYEDKYFDELIEKMKKNTSIKFAPQTLEHENEHVLEDLARRLAQQNMDLDTYFKVRNTTREKFIESDVRPVARKRLERSLILDEVIRKEKIEIDNNSLDKEFNATVNNLSMQGLDFNKIRGGNQGKQRVAEALAMESATRLLTKRALDLLKSIATGEYKKSQEKKVETDPTIVEAAEPKKQE